MKVTLALLLFVLSVTTLVSQDIIYKDEVERINYKTSEFVLNYPFSWELDTSGTMGTSFFLFSPLEFREDKFRENINLIIQDIPGIEMDLEKYTSISIDQIKQLIQDALIISSTRMKNHGVPFQRLEYTGRQGNFNLHFIQFYQLKNQKAYVLTLTLEDTSTSEMRQTGISILNSFKTE